MVSCGDPNGLMRRPKWSHAETQMVSVRKWNIQDIYKVDTIVYGTYNVGTWSFHLFVLFQDVCAKLKATNHVPALSSHNSVTVNSIGVNTKNRKDRKKTGKNVTRFCWCLHDACKPNFYAAVCDIDWYKYLAKEMGSDLLHFSNERSPQ